ncbi:uncharacterized protein UHOD_00750 [Ustilago sp. UG-2017b]|nr:uncharacterized protein UHOD_00750 [Ustilago sp. UG-2017b]
MDDDDVDFFTRRPLPSKSKAKDKPKALAKSTNGINDKAGEGSGRNGTQTPSSSATVSAPSALALSSLTAQVIGDSEDDNEDVVGNDDEDDEDTDTLMYSSDVDVSSDDSDTAAKRRAKRRKKKHTKILPAWASQGVFRRLSQEPSFSLSTDVFHDAQSVLPSASKGNGATASADTTDGNGAPNSSATGGPNANGRRERGVSLTPPPPPSPEKLSKACDLVSRVMGSKIPAPSTTAPTVNGSSSTATAPALRRSTRSSATLGVGNGTASSSVLSPGSSRRGAGVVDDDDDDVDGLNQINWDPDLARLMRGQNAKHIREQAKREQQERDAKRKQRELERIRQQPSSNPGPSERQAQFSRTQSAPQARSGAIRIAEDGNDTDDSVEFVARPTKPNTSPRRTRSSTAAGNAASQSQATSKNGKDAAIVIDDSDDDGAPASKTNGNHPSTSQVVDGDDDDDDAGDIRTNGAADQETLDLTLQSKLGPMQVTVTPTTKLLTITTHFHTKQLVPANLGDKIKPDQIKVMFDGFAFKPTQTVADMDVEEGDQVELSWPS